MAADSRRIIGDRALRKRSPEICSQFNAVASIVNYTTEVDRDPGQTDQLAFRDELRAAVESELKISGDSVTVINPNQTDKIQFKNCIY